jgi:hypothetical protein
LFLFDGSLESTVTVAEHNVNTEAGRLVIGHEDIEFAVAVEIADRDAAALWAGGGDDVGFEDAIAVP